MTRIVQLTDLHLFQDADGVLAGVRTWDSFQAVLEKVERQCADYDYMVLTGDIAHDENPRTYALLREALRDWLPRLRLIPGNHDDRQHLRAAFPALFDATHDTLGFCLAAGGWRIIGLDSQVPGAVYGRVSASQIERLQQILAREPGTPTLVFIHHPPVAIGVEWLDDMGLETSDGLVELIEVQPAIKLVCAGHVHQDFHTRIGDAHMVTTPSTCVQFGSRADQKFDPAAAGFRTIELEADRYHTEVHRVGPSTAPPA